MTNRQKYYALGEFAARAVKAIRHTDENKVYFKTPDEVSEKSMKAGVINMIMAIPRYGFIVNDNDNIFERLIGGFYLLIPVNEKENYIKQNEAIETCKAAAQDVFCLFQKLRKTIVSGGPIIKDFNPKDISGSDEGLMIGNSFGVYFEYPIAEPNNFKFDDTKYDMDIVNAISF
jgi:hypothetical protein